jgi:hypothetical protein
MKASIIGCPPQTRLAPDAAGKAVFFVMKMAILKKDSIKSGDKFFNMFYTSPPSGVGRRQHKFG